MRLAPDGSMKHYSDEDRTYTDDMGYCPKFAVKDSAYMRAILLEKNN